MSEEISKFQAIRRATTTLERIDGIEVNVIKDNDEMCTIEVKIQSIPIEKKWYWQSSEELEKALVEQIKAVFGPYKTEAIAAIAVQHQKL